MEKFQIDPDEERKRHEEALEKVDPRIAEILRKHLTYPTPLPQEEKPSTPQEFPQNTSQFKTFIERSQQNEKD